MALGLSKCDIEGGGVGGVGSDLGSAYIILISTTMFTILSKKELTNLVGKLANPKRQNSLKKFQEISCKNGWGVGQPKMAKKFQVFTNK